MSVSVTSLELSDQEIYQRPVCCNTGLCAVKHLTARGGGGGGGLGKICNSGLADWVVQPCCKWVSHGEIPVWNNINY